MSQKTDLRRLGLSELQALVRGLGLPEYRYRQIARWLYDKAVDSIDEMTDLSRDLRADLEREFEVRGLEMKSRVDSRIDGSSKYLFGLEGGGSVESVFMPTEKRVTLCISSQIGCTLDCVFCQTGQMGFHRNLSGPEIVGQVLPLWKRAREARPRTNVVFMGMGEPLHNVREVEWACRLLTDPLGLNLNPKRITVSTAGVVPGIRKLADTGLGVRLALSLNATTQADRERLMPRAARMQLDDVMESAADYARRYRDRVTLEYVLMQGENDRPEDAERLASLARRGPFKINLIPYNPGASDGLTRPDGEHVGRFARLLYPRAPVVTVRWSMGPDIAAACGQLKIEMERKAKKSPPPPMGDGRRTNREETSKSPPGGNRRS